MHRENFAHQLKKLVTDSGISQNSIAELLGVTAAAVSQYLNGVTLPSSSHLRKILDLTRASKQEEYVLNCTLSLARTEPRNTKSSEFNRAFFNMHLNSGLALDQLAVRIGIPVSRLRAMESDPEVEPTEQETALLKGFFGIYYANAVEQKNERISLVREECGFSSGIPQISIFKLRDFNPKRESLHNFACRNRREVATLPVFGVVDPVMVICKSEAVKFAYPGLLQILLAAESPQGYLPLFLYRYADGSFELVSEDTVKNDTVKRKPNLVLPVVEIKMHPVEVEELEI